MQCKSCGYSLWNLPGHICPECGVSYDIHELRFRPETVAFACPQCGRHHAGQGERYLPADEPTMNCRGCDRTLEVRDMPVVLLADDPDQAIAAEGDPLQWEKRIEIGYSWSFARTWALGTFKPHRLAGRLLADQGLRDSYWFAVRCWFIGWFSGVTIVVFAFLSSWLIDERSEVLIVVKTLAIVLLSLMASMTWAGLWVPLVCGSCAAAAHGFLVLSGQVRGGFNTTWRSFLYGQGPIAFGMVPFVGWFLFPLFQFWALICTTIIVSRSQQIHPMRAVAACFYLPLTVVAMVTAVIVVLS